MVQHRVKGGQQSREGVVRRDVEDSALGQHATEEIADDPEGLNADQAEGDQREWEQVFNDGP